MYWSLLFNIMKLKKNLAVRRVGRQYIVVDLSSTNVNIADVYTMNATAAWLWERIGGDSFTSSMLVDWLCARYDVEASRAAGDVEAMLADWRRFGLVVDD